MAKHADDCLVLVAGAFGARCSGNVLGALRREHHRWLGTGQELGLTNWKPRWDEGISSGHFQ